MTSSGDMSSLELMQQVALLRWLCSQAEEDSCLSLLSPQSEEDRGLLTAVTGVRVAREMLNRFTGQKQLDAYKRECVLSIAEFINKNPRASQNQINSEVEKRVLQFAARVQALESAPIL